jgi:hypothetical protein
MIRTSQPGWNEGAITLSASRSRLRTLLRTTAPPSLRPVERPKRVSSRPVLRIRTTSMEWDRTDPSPCSAAKSWGLESITSRGGLWPRSVVRPRASCGRERGGRPILGVPRSSSSGRGSRASCFDAASWADRSASWDGVFLSIRPRVRIPRKARERAVRTKALWRVCRRIICTRNSECQTDDNFLRRCRAPTRARRRIPPGSMRFGTIPSLARAVRPVLFFVGPRRQTALGIGSEDP